MAGETKRGVRGRSARPKVLVGTQLLPVRVCVRNFGSNPERPVGDSLMLISWSLGREGSGVNEEG